MYAWIWRHLPGEPLTRACTALGIVAVICLVLWYAVFPRVEPKIHFDHGTVGGETSAPARPGAP